MIINPGQSSDENNLPDWETLYLYLYEVVKEIEAQNRTALLFKTAEVFYLPPSLAVWEQWLLILLFSNFTAGMCKYLHYITGVCIGYV